MTLLDTHVLVWARTRPDALSAPAARAIAEARSAGGGVAVAAITLWELARLFARGRLRTALPTERAVIELLSDSSVLPLTVPIAAVAAMLPPTFPGDPADRLIGATAVVHRLDLVTADAAIRGSRVVPTIW
jgi:PIN domain nuclease of toxin-antitoxin system